MKIHIIGCSGTGKTWLAKKLSEKYSIPCYDLDDLQWDNKADTYGVKNPPDMRDALLKRILTNDNWIIEGVYFGWVGDSFAAADQIYILDIPPRVYKRRILHRFIRRKLGMEHGKRETWRSVSDLFRWTDRYQQNNLPKIRILLEPYGHKVRILRCSKEIKEILKENRVSC